MSRFSGARPSTAAALALVACVGAAETAPTTPTTPPSATDAASALDRALAESNTAASATPSPRDAAPRPALAEVRSGPATLRLADLSLDVLTVAGASTETDPRIPLIEGGDHDPKRRGFTLQQAEVSLFGAVDPYFTAEAHIVFKEDAVEIEEAYGTTTDLPYGLQAKAGYFLAEFGRTNPQHPHQWPWLDQPIIVTRVFGPDGTRGPGARVAWLAPLPWFSEVLVTAMDATDASAVSFRGGARDGVVPTTVGGRPDAEATTRSLADLLWVARWVNATDLTRGLFAQVGLSGALGPNQTGGRTLIGGADLLVKWRDAATSWRQAWWQTEIVARRFRADAGLDAGAVVPADTLTDQGIVSEVLYAFAPRWAAGLRVEYATGAGGSYVVGDLVTPGGPLARDADPLRDDRWRIAPLVTFNPSEFSRFRLQYDYDHADRLEGHAAHSVWLGLELMIGAHPAHTY